MKTATTPLTTHTLHYYYGYIQDIILLSSASAFCLFIFLQMNSNKDKNTEEVNDTIAILDACIQIVTKRQKARDQYYNNKIASLQSQIAVIQQQQQQHCSVTPNP